MTYGVPYKSLLGKNTMDKKIYDTYIEILKSELVPALGCTEPIAIAYASAKAAQTLGTKPEKIELWCSGNILKNTMSVTVPHSNGQRGVEAAAILGAIGGNADAELEVLEDVTEEQIAESKDLVKSGYCVCHLMEGVDNLYVKVIMYGSNGDTAQVCLEKKHTYLSHIEKNGEVLLERHLSDDKEKKADTSILNVKDILTFADSLREQDVQELFERQLKLNDAIAQVGLSEEYGSNIGKTLLRYGKDSVEIRARARAAAGSDARMNGCPLPVVINAGSGNQGITISMPILEYAEAMSAEKELIYKALAVGNLVSVHLKRHIGNLSAYCGATNAACGAVCGIAYMKGERYQTIAGVITNTLGTISGMVCDGAKSSCAAKISVALECAFNSLDAALSNNAFQPGEGLVEDDLEKTIQNYGRMGKEGMQSTDVKILNLMLHND